MDGTDELVATTAPSDGRALRRQGRKTMARLLDAGLVVLAERGYHAARVDDVVRVAKVSHGTFYLYFSNKEALVRALAEQCAAEMSALAGTLGPVGPGEDGLEALEAWVGAFQACYRRYGVVIRAWMEDQITDRTLARLGARTFSTITGSLVEHLAAARSIDEARAGIEAAALLAMLERFTYYAVSRELELDDDAVVHTLAVLAHRGFFVP